MCFSLCRGYLYSLSGKRMWAGGELYKGQSPGRVACPSSWASFAFVLGLVSSSTPGLLTPVGDCFYSRPLLTNSVPFLHTCSPTPGKFRPVPETLERMLAGPLPPQLFWRLKEAPWTLQPVKTVASFTILANMSMLWSLVAAFYNSIFKMY